MRLTGKTVLVTGGARRIGATICVAIAKEGGDVIIHHGHSNREAQELSRRIRGLGQNAYVIKADLTNPDETLNLISEARKLSQFDAVINNAAIFTSDLFQDTSLSTWQKNMMINLTAPFLLSQQFSKQKKGRIINILDWRALRPGADHFSYTISKAGLVALTKSLAISLAPDFPVNGLAFGAILPPSDSGKVPNILDKIPARRWGKLTEVGEAIVFLLTGPEYITGEIIHLDGGRHLI